MKEMVGGCCVCSDERGWPENPLVYCDGLSCTVAVHQACYGIVAVPTGPWFCRKCECEESTARCVLCPWKDGALKRTDEKQWAHVVCALYIPEIRFGNVSTMEPIILQLIPSERFSKTCYICQDKGKGSKASYGACMQCNKAGCKQQFHVTCAQTLGLLCEEAGNYLDNVKYCGYCQHHYSKLKKNGNVKTIPPYQPIGRADLSDPPSSPEKEKDSCSLPPIQPSAAASSSSSSSAALPHSVLDSKQSSQNGSHKSAQRKTSSSASCSGTAVSSPSTQRTTSYSSKLSTIQPQPSNANQSLTLNSSSSSSNLSSDTLNSSGVDGGSANSNVNTKESNNLSGKTSSKSSSSRSSSSSSKSSSKESSRDSKHSKVSRHHSKDSPASNDYDQANSSASNASASNNPISIYGQKFTTSNFTETVVVPSESVFSSSKSPLNQPAVKKRKTDSAKTSGIIGDDANSRDVLRDISVTLTPLVFDKSDSNTTDAKKKGSESDIIQSTHATNINSTIIRQNEDSSHRSSVGLNVSLPLTPATITAVSSPSATQNQISTIKSLANSEPSPNTNLSRSQIYPNIVIQQPADLHAKDPLYLGEKPTGAIVRNPSPSPSFATTSMDNSLKITIKAPPTADDSNYRITSTPDDNSNPFSDLKISYEAQPNTYDSGTLADVKISPPSSPNSGTIENKTNHAPISDSTNDTKNYRPKEVMPTHMLGNQLNPASTVAQKMSDQFLMEMETHGPYTAVNLDAGAQLIGPAFPAKQTNNARCPPPQPQGLSLASMLSGNGAATAHGSTPQSLEQLLERQWEQGSQFLMDQANHLDIAGLLSCLHHLRSENIKLEEHINSLVARRDHLVAVNARLAIPLNQAPQSQSSNATFNSLHLNGTSEPSSRSRSHHLK